MDIRHKLIEWRRTVRLACVFFLALAACISEERGIPATPTTPSDGQEVSFSLVIPAQTQTRAVLSEPDERAIRTVRLLLFKETNGVMTYFFGADGSNIRELSPVRKAFDVRLPAGTYDVVILANAQEIVNSANPAQGDAKDKVLKALTEKNTGVWKGNAIPMWGRTDRLTVGDLSGAGNPKEIEMIRMLAKIDVEIASSATDFTLSDVRFYNYSSQGALAPDLASWPADNLAVAPTQPDLTGGYATVATPLLFDSVAGVTAKECKQMIYTYEAPAGSRATTEKNPCLVIGGRYKGGEVTYYRVDFTSEVNGQLAFLPLLRNCYYLIKVTLVSGNGYATPDVAFKSPPANMNTVLLQWTEQGMNKVIFDGEYMLGVSTDRLTLPSDEQSTAGEKNQLTIKTTVPTGWEIEKMTDATGTAGTAPWLSLSALNGTAGVAQNVFVFTEKNTSSNLRTGYLYIRSQKLRYCVEVTQDTVPGFGVEIVNFSTGKLVNLYDFTRQEGQVKEFKVTWKPAKAKVTVYVSHPGNAFSGAGVPANGTVLSGGSTVFTITSKKVDSDRLTRLDFTLIDGTRTEIKTLFLRQKQ